MKPIIPLGLTTAAVLALSGCAPKGRLISTTYESRVLDTIAVVASASDTPKAYTRAIYNPSAERKHDLLHTKLDVRFDWEKQYLYGIATLDLTPVFYASNTLRLDAKGFDINAVTLSSPTQGLLNLRYKYENNKDLYITLDRVYKAGEKYTITINYVAKPNELPLGGSAAITSDKGLYFINPLGKEADKPQQIWTQGETESSSCWFPTIDRPNERCTQEVFMTVQDRFKTLSNGVLTNSTKNNDGTRTDYWVMEDAHAPYLFMMTVGEFFVDTEVWNGISLEYMVEEKYKDATREIYKNTPEMLTFFSDLLGVNYPWSKYAQVVVRDYVSGAMENTTAVIFGDFIQLTKRELLDHSDLNEGIVAHEMMHHWFGDLVTCESWANLPLNESFANYSEYLWFEHKYGKDAADYIRKNEIGGYLNQAIGGGDMHPLINYNYADKEDMFDAHSYNKGGAILHMLRHHLGDKAFFAGLKKYLTDHAYSATEVHDLRLAFEALTGKDLNWFFNQWFFAKGHPKLTISKIYDVATETLEITLEQKQDLKEQPCFILPFEIDVYTSETGEPLRQEFTMTKQKETFKIKIGEAPIWVAVDPERVLLAERTYKQTPEELIIQYKKGNYQDRFEALRELKYHQKNRQDVRAVYTQAFQDDFWALRRDAIDAVALKDTAADLTAINGLVADFKTEPRSHVRAAILQKLSAIGSPVIKELAVQAVREDSSYLVAGAALQAIHKLDEQTALTLANALENSENESVVVAVAAIFEATGATKYVPFFESKWKAVNNYNRLSFMSSYARLLIKNGDEQLMQQKLPYFEEMATSKDVSLWGHYAAANAVKLIYDAVAKDFEADKKGLLELLATNKEAKKKDVDKDVEALTPTSESNSYEAIYEKIEFMKGNSVDLLRAVEKLQENTTATIAYKYLVSIKNKEESETLLRIYNTWVK